MLTVRYQDLCKHREAGCHHDLLWRLCFAKRRDIRLRKILKLKGWFYTLYALHVCNHPEVVPIIAADFAERTLPVYEECRPDDDRPRRLLESVRNGTVTHATVEAVGESLDDLIKDSSLPFLSLIYNAGKAVYFVGCITEERDTVRSAHYFSHVSYDAISGAKSHTYDSAVLREKEKREREWQVQRLFWYCDNYEPK
ncbi:MAG: hypothetical protein JW885_02550 [Deltaproteobacteria bacterium]|nr:hypothetical protein [Candidatus Zymogenaceae bacterium]